MKFNLIDKIPLVWLNKTIAEKRAIHIASGDISRVKSIDILVNSENDYMQMACFFESRTVSSMLRRHGVNFFSERGKVESLQRMY